MLVITQGQKLPDVTNISFVFDQDKKVFENMIEEYECEEVMENTDLCLRHNQNKCIDLNDITDPNCECR